MGKDFTPFRMAGLKRVAGGGAGPGGREGGAAWGCLDSISRITSGEGVARPSEVRGLMAFLYCPSWKACLALRMLLEEAPCASAGGGLWQGWPAHTLGG